MDQKDAQATRPRLGAVMRQLRRERQLTGIELARDLGVTQGTISKIECGRLAPDVGYIARFAQLLSLTGKQTSELFRLAGVVPDGCTPSAFLRFVPFELDQDNWAQRRQDTFAMVEQRASHIQVYQPQLVPGLLQTPAYAREVLSAAGVRGEIALARAVAARLKRQRNLLDPLRRFSFIITEAALLTRPDGAEVQHEQLAHLLDVVHHAPKLRLGILPFGVAYPVPPPPSFYVLDDRVYIELPHGDLWLLRSSGHVGHYADLFELLTGLCLFGQAAAAKLEQSLRRFHPQRRALH